MKITDDFHYKRIEASHSYYKIDTFRDEQRLLKEGPGESMKNVLYVQWYSKRHLSGWSDVEQQKIKPVASSYVSLRASLVSIKFP